MNKSLTTTVDFHGDSLIVVDVDGQQFVAMKYVADGMGLNWGVQQKKLTNQSNKFNHIHMDMVALDGKQREMLCIPLLKLQGWLFTINPSKVKAELRSKVVQYQEECFEVLHAHFMSKQQQPKPGQLIAPENYAQALRALADAHEQKERQALMIEHQSKEIERKDSKIEVMKPKERFYDHVGKADGALTLTEAAQSFQTGQRKFIDELRKLKLLRHTSPPLPYQEYLNQGWFKVVQVPIDKGYKTDIVTQTLITAKGSQSIKYILDGTTFNREV